MKKGLSTRKFSLSAMLAAGVLAVLLLIYWGYRNVYPNRIGPEQPIPFSHRVHATEKQISCFMCHTGADDGARAGIPPLETCMLCHSRIIIAYPPVRQVRRHYFDKEPIFWKRVFSLPDFVYFNHSVHIHRGIDCARCHGDIAHADRIEEHGFIMGFCIQCHRDHNATHDCFTCHR